MPKEIDNKTYYQLTEACKMAGISRSTLLRWIDNGMVADAERRDRKGWRLFSEEEVKGLREYAQRTG